jgi:hypothetical protein
MKASPQQQLDAPGAGRWKALHVSILCLVPVALLASWTAMYAARGPSWLGSNLDPDYVYLLNGLSILHGYGPQHVDHPGTPVQLMVALDIRITHLLTGHGPVAEDVIGRPEYYLAAASGVLLLLFAGALLVAGLVALRTTGSLLAGLAMQLLPGLSPLIALHVTGVKPEPFLAALTALLAALVLRTLDPARPRWRVPEAVLFGLLVGLAVAAKVTAAPLAVIPLVLLSGLAARALFAGVTMLTLALATIPAWPALGAFFGFITGIATHSGQHGSGRPSVFDPSEYLDGLQLLARQNWGGIPVAVGAIGAIAALALALRVRREGGAATTAARNALAASVAMQAVSYLLVARHAASHYILPAVVMAGLTAALSIHAARLLAPAATQRVAWVAAVLLGFFAFKFGQGIGARRAETASRRDAQLEVVARLEREFSGVRVLHHYTSSSPAYALHFGDTYTGAKWSRLITDRHPRHLYYNIWNDRLEVDRPRPGDPMARPIDFDRVTRDILCGENGGSPLVAQGTPFQALPPTVHGLPPLDGVMELVFSSGIEALYSPRGCGESSRP